MTEQKKSFSDWPTYLAKAAGGLVLLLGIAVMAGWFTDSPILVQLQPQWVPMHFNTALSFILCGAGLLFLIYTRRQSAIACGVFVMVLSSLTLLEYICGLNLGIGQLFIEPSITIKSSYPSRMALTTALTFLLSGIGLVILRCPVPTERQDMIFGLLGTIIAAIGVGTPFGYLLGTDTPFNGSHSATAVHTAIGFILLGSGMLVIALRDYLSEGKWPNWIAAVLGMGFTTLVVSLWLSLLTYGHMQAEQVMTKQAKSLQVDIALSINQEVQALARMARRWERHNGTAQDFWRADAEHYLEDNPALRVISWVDSSQKVRWLEPAELDEFDQNLDSFLDLRKAEAMERARKMRVATAAPSIELIQGGRAIFVYIPLYVGDRFDGFINGVLHIQTLLEPIVEVFQSKDFSIRLLEDDTEIYHHIEPSTVYESGLSQDQVLSILNLNWRLSLRPSQSFLARLTSPLPLVVLMVGLLLTSLMVLALHYTQVAGQRADRLTALNQELATENDERKRIEQSLEESSLWLQGIITAMEVGVIVVTPDRRLVSLNPAAQAMLGYSQEEVSAQPTEMLHVDHEHAVEFGKRIQAAFDKGDAARFEYELRRKNGEIFPTEHKVSLIKDGTGQAIGMVSTLRDITMHKQIHEELRTYREHLKEMITERTRELEISNAELQKVIDKQRRTRAALRDREHYLQAMFKNMQEGVITTDKDLIIESANPEALTMLGYDSEHLLGQNVEILIPPADIARHAQSVKSLLEQEHQRHPHQQSSRGLPIGPREVTARHADGTDFPMSMAVGEMWLNGQRNFIAIIKDITKRKMAEEALKQSEEQFRKTVELSPIPIVIIDAQGNFEHLNRKFIELYGWSSNDIRTHEEWWKAAYPDEMFRDKVRKGWQAAIQKADKEDLEFEPQYWPLICKNGERKDVEFRMARLAAGRIVITMDDITEWKADQQALESSQARLRQLAAYLQNVREDERARISRDVHDDVGQVLTALNMEAHSLKLLTLNDNGEIHERILSMLPLISSAITTVQRITAELRPPMLDQLGLDSAIQWHVEAFQERTGIKCALSIGLNGLQLDRERATAVFRIMQEALTNVARHAEASRVSIEIHKVDKHLEMKIEDNGQGASPSAINASNSFGLLGMQERAHVFGGKVEIEGQPDNGTTVSLYLPLHDNAVAI